MKKSQLTQIIREEVRKVMSELKTKKMFAVIGKDGKVAGITSDKFKADKMKREKGAKSVQPTDVEESFDADFELY